MKIKWDDLIAAFAVGVIIGFLLGNSFSSHTKGATEWTPKNVPNANSSSCLRILIQGQTDQVATEASARSVNMRLITQEKRHLGTKSMQNIEQDWLPKKEFYKNHFSVNLVGELDHLTDIIQIIKNHSKFNGYVVNVIQDKSHNSHRFSSEARFETLDGVESGFIIMRVTAYCPCDRCCGKWSDGVTASGHIIKEDDAFVAAPSSFPFGTILDISGYGKVPVLDRGGAIKGNRLDVFFHTHQEALNWGVKYLKVEVQK